MSRLSPQCAAGAPFLCEDPRCQNEVHGETPVGQAAAAPGDHEHSRATYEDGGDVDVCACGARRSNPRDGPPGPWEVFA